MGSGHVAAIAIAGVLAAPTTTFAGRSHYGRLFGTEVVPERGVEIESWLSEENQKGDTNVDETWWLLAIAVGITDQVELAIPVDILWQRDEPMPSRFTIASYGAELRWRLVPSDPVDAPPVVPLIRVAAMRITGDRKGALLEADAVVSFEQSGFHAAADVGIAAVVHEGEDAYELHPGAAASYEVIQDLRLGVEVDAELGLRGGAVDWVTAGPSLGWTHGRFWLSAVAAIGLHQIQSAPRLKLGVAF